MDLKLEGKLFVVTGATSGFGRAIAITLIDEGAHVILNARGEEKLNKLKSAYPDQVETVAGDITTDATMSEIICTLGLRRLDGVLMNAGGPPAKSFVATEMNDWDDSYASILRWKVKFTKILLDKFVDQQYGRILYIESVSVKQPVENLVLSNSLRLAVVGFVKTLSQEIADQGITLNILAPGYHATPAMERLFSHKSMLLGITPAEARQQYESETKMSKLGNPENLASLAIWLLSEKSSFITGQTISVDGGLVKGTMG